jgi:hypothetical protein
MAAKSNQFATQLDAFAPVQLGLDLRTDEQKAKAEELTSVTHIFNEYPLPSLPTPVSKTKEADYFCPDCGCNKALCETTTYTDGHTLIEVECKSCGYYTWFTGDTESSGDPSQSGRYAWNG